MLEKTPESPLDSKEILRESNQSILREINPQCSLEGLMLSDANRRLIRKVPDAGEDRGQREKRVSEDEMAGRITDAMSMNLGRLQEMVRDREA